MLEFEQMPILFKCRVKNHLQEIDAQASIQINTVLENTVYANCQKVSWFLVN